MMNTMRVAGPPGYELTAEQLLKLERRLKWEGLRLLEFKSRGTLGQSSTPVWTRYDGGRLWRLRACCICS